METNTEILAKVKTSAKERKADEWYTPKVVLKNIENLFFLKLEYDPATTIEQANYLDFKFFDTKETNSLDKEWKYKNIWMNPPFSTKKLFIEKALNEFNKGYIDNIFILVPDYTLTNVYMSELIPNLKGYLNLIIPKGRLRFETDIKNTTFKDSKELKYKMQSPIFGSIILMFSKRLNFGIVWKDLAREEI